MNSELYNLRGRDFLNSALSAIAVAVVFSLNGVFQQAGFSIFDANWGVILGDAINVAIIAFIGVLSHQFVQDKDGRAFGSV